MCYNYKSEGNFARGVYKSIDMANMIVIGKQCRQI